VYLSKNGVACTFSSLANFFGVGEIGRLNGASFVFGSVKYFGDGSMEGKESADKLDVDPGVNGTGRPAATEFKIDGWRDTTEYVFVLRMIGGAEKAAECRSVVGP
jgi:hypothetical protein